MAETKPEKEEIQEARKAHFCTLFSYLLPAFPVIGWTIAPIVNLVSPIYFWFKNRKKSYYAKEQAKEAIYMQSILAIAWNLVVFLEQPWMGFAIFGIGLFHIISFIVAMVSVSYGKDFHYPFSVFQNFRSKKDGFAETEFSLKQTDIEPGMKELYAEVLKNSFAKAKEIDGYKTQIKDPRIALKVDAIRIELDKFFEDFKKDPNDIKKSRQFLSYYLDTTVNILKKYVELKNSGGNSPEIQETLGKVEEVLDSILKAFRKFYPTLLENDVMDLDVEMKVLQQTMKADGF